MDTSLVDRPAHRDVDRLHVVVNLLVLDYCVIIVLARQ